MYTKFVTLNIKFSFTCTESDLCQKMMKFQNIFLLLPRFSMTIYVSGESTYLAKNVGSIKKNANNQNILKLNFDLNETYNQTLTQNQCLWSFNGTEFHNVFIKQEKSFAVIEYVREWRFGQDLADLWAKISLLRRSWTKFLEQVEQSGKVGQD